MSISGESEKEEVMGEGIGESEMELIRQLIHNHNVY